MANLASRLSAPPGELKFDESYFSNLFKESMITFFPPLSAKIWEKIYNEIEPCGFTGISSFSEEAWNKKLEKKYSKKSTFGFFFRNSESIFELNGVDYGIIPIKIRTFLYGLKVLICPKNHAGIPKNTAGLTKFYIFSLYFGLFWVEFTPLVSETVIFRNLRICPHVAEPM